MNNLYDKQGINFLQNRNNRSIRVGKNPDKNEIQGYLNSNKVPNTLIEGFNNSAIDKINDKEYNQLRDIETEFQRELQNYNTLKQNLMETTQGYLETSQGGNPSKGQNVRIGNKYGYVTDAGLFKEYQSPDIANNTSGNNGCPANWESAPQIDNHFPNDFSNQLFESIPGQKPLINGLPMQNAQGCGMEGSNVFVSKPGPTTKKYIGIYNNISGSDMKLQDDLGYTNIEQCKSRATLKNKEFFAMSDFDGSNAQCYIGNNQSPLISSGTSVKTSVVKDMGIKNPDDTKSPYLFMGYDGRIHAFSGNNNYWTSDNKPIDGCDPIGGGHIYVGPGSGASATYGQNCSNWNIKPNFAATGLGGTDPLPGNLTRIQKKGNKAL